MKITFTLTFFFLLIFSLLSYSQDSTQKKIQFHIGFESHAQQHFYDMYARVSQPEYIKRIRKNYNSLPVGFDTVTDNPYQHGAMYAAIKTSTIVANKLEVKADLYGEYRGFSYGTFNNKNNRVLFPVVSIRGKDTLQIGKRELMIEGKVGQFLNERVDEGLMIYNIDLQGVQAKLRYRQSQLAFTIYGDLDGAIGLNIDDLKSLSLEQFFKNDSARLGISLVIAAPPSAPARFHSCWNAFGSVYTGNGWKLFAQVSYRHALYPQLYDRVSIGWNTKIALIAGFEKEFVNKRFYTRNRTEARYYGYIYNDFYFDNTYKHRFRYRDSAWDIYSMYGNTVGQYLYPLRKFDTPFSQWAVFTEYGGHNLWAVTSIGECSYAMANKFNLGLDYDINAILGKLDKSFYLSPGEKRTSFFVYPFFKAWARYFPVKECYLSVFVSNKTMNLDLGYPTHYLLKRPFLGVELFCKI